MTTFTPALSDFYYPLLFSGVGLLLAMSFALYAVRALERRLRTQFRIELDGLHIRVDRLIERVDALERDIKPPANGGFAPVQYAELVAEPAPLPGERNWGANRADAATPAVTIVFHQATLRPVQDIHADAEREYRDVCGDETLNPEEGD